jgi:hypothetical protein
MGWKELIAAAVLLWEQAERIMGYVRSLGVSQEDIDTCIAKNRAKRAAQIAADVANEWPGDG